MSIDATVFAMICSNGNVPVRHDVMGHNTVLFQRTFERNNCDGHRGDIICTSQIPSSTLGKPFSVLDFFMTNGCQMFLNASWLCVGKSGVWEQLSHDTLYIISCALSERGSTQLQRN
jgi:hypothetical protein